MPPCRHQLTINVEIEPLVFYSYCFIGTSIFENLDDESKNNNIINLLAFLVRVYIYIIYYYLHYLHGRKGDAIIRCVEETLLSRCEDPTPSNLLHGLLTAMRTATPCSAVSSAPAPAPARYTVQLQT